MTAVSNQRPKDIKWATSIINSLEPEIMEDILEEWYYVAGMIANSMCYFHDERGQTVYEYKYICKSLIDAAALIYQMRQEADIYKYIEVISTPIPEDKGSDPRYHNWGIKTELSDWIANKKP